MFWIWSQELHYIHDKIKKRMEEIKSSQFEGLKSSRVLLKKLIKDKPNMILKIFTDLNKKDDLERRTFNQEVISAEDQDEL